MKKFRREDRVVDPRTTWTGVMAKDLAELSFGLHTVWRKAQDRTVWHHIVDTATLSDFLPPGREVILRQQQIF